MYLPKVDGPSMFISRLTIPSELEISIYLVTLHLLNIVFKIENILMYHCFAGPGEYKVRHGHP